MNPCYDLGILQLPFYYGYGMKIQTKEINPLKDIALNAGFRVRNCYFWDLTI